MRSVAVLVTDHRLHAAGSEEIANLHAFGAGERHRFLHRDQLRPAFDADAYHRHSQVRQRAETEHIRANRAGELARIRRFRGYAELRGSRVQAALVLVADSGNLKSRISLKRGGM